MQQQHYDLLKFHLDLGANEFISEQPTCKFRFNNEKIIISKPQWKSKQPKKAPLVVKTKQYISLKDVCEEVSAIKNFSLQETAHHLVFGEGNETSDIMVIGQAPNIEDDWVGLPFQGKQGALLKNILASIQINFEDVYRTNTVYWRPPRDRLPNKDEIDFCYPFLEQQIQLVSPRVVILLGKTPTETFYKQDYKPSKMVGMHKTTSIGAANIEMIALPTLKSMMNTPQQKHQVWQALLNIKKRFLL
jgi:uracil-DNA glycosylase